MPSASRIDFLVGSRRLAFSRDTAAWAFIPCFICSLALRKRS